MCDMMSTNQFYPRSEHAVPQTQHMEETLADVPKRCRAKYIEHWDSIRTRCSESGDRYNICLPSSQEAYAAHLWSVYDSQKCAFNVNFSYGLIIRDMFTNVKQYWYNECLLIEPQDLSYGAIRSRKDFATVIQMTLNSDATDYLERTFEQQRDSIWTVDVVANVTVYVNKMNEQLSIVSPLNVLKIDQKS